MISSVAALHSIEGMTTNEVEAFARERLLGRNEGPVSSPHLLEPAEDVVIALLLLPDIPEGARQALLAACRSAYALVLSALAQRPLVEPSIAQILTRLSRLVDIAGPEPLRGHAEATLNLLLEQQERSPDLLAASVRAVNGYSQTLDKLDLWYRVLDEPEVAAYAFNALLSLNLPPVRIAKALESLWRRQVLDGWPVDTPFLARRAAKVFGNTVVRMALRSLKDDSALGLSESYWDRIVEDLERRSWSRPWVALTTEGERVENLPSAVREVTKSIQVYPRFYDSPVTAVATELSLQGLLRGYGSDEVSTPVSLYLPTPVVGGRPAVRYKLLAERSWFAPEHFLFSGKRLTSLPQGQILSYGKREGNGGHF